MAKRMDWFLVVEKVVDRHHFIKQWVGCGGKLDHLTIFLELKNGPVKQPSSLKFNKTWLNDDYFLSLIFSKWILFDIDSRRTATLQFAANIHNLKDVIKDWLVEKRRREDREQKQVEKELYEILDKEGRGMLN